jgi:predicted Zn-dependent protease
VLLLRTQALLRTGQAGEAASQLRTWVADHAYDAGAWQALAQADAAQGQMLRSLRAEGEAALAQRTTPAPSTAGAPRRTIRASTRATARR